MSEAFRFGSFCEGLVESAPVLRNELGENLRELISLRCLEQLYGPANINETTSDVPQDLDSGPMFELSRSCEDVLGDILQEVYIFVQPIHVFFFLDTLKQFLISCLLA